MAVETFPVQRNQYLTSILGKSPKRKPLVRLTGTDVSARGRAYYEDASFLLSYPCAGGGLLFTLFRSIFTVCPISSPMCFACTVLLLDQRTCATENLRAMNLSEEKKKKKLKILGKIHGSVWRSLDLTANTVSSHGSSSWVS